MDLRGDFQVIEQQGAKSNRPVSSGSPALLACLLGITVTCFSHHEMTIAQDTDSLAVLV